MINTADIIRIRTKRNVVTDSCGNTIRTSILKPNKLWIRGISKNIKKVLIKRKKSGNCFSFVYYRILLNSCLGINDFFREFLDFLFSTFQFGSVLFLLHFCSSRFCHSIFFYFPLTQSLDSDTLPRCFYFAATFIRIFSWKSHHLHYLSRHRTKRFYPFVIFSWPKTDWKEDEEKKSTKRYKRRTWSVERKWNKSVATTMNAYFVFFLCSFSCFEQICKHKMQIKRNSVTYTFWKERRHNNNNEKMRVCAPKIAKVMEKFIFLSIFQYNREQNVTAK